MATLTMLRDIALQLPEVKEGTHFGMVAFSVAGNGFISLTKDETVQLLMGPDEAQRALAAHPTARRIE